jgi:hypothetical protein
MPRPMLDNPNRKHCSVCGHPSGLKSCASRTRPGVYALDVELHKLFPEEWAEPRQIAVTVSGLCSRCVVAQRRAENE